MHKNQRVTLMPAQSTPSRYTNTLSTFELMELFPTDDSARNYFESKLWGDTPRCAHCSNHVPNTIYKDPSRRGLYRCRSCDSKFTVQTNTVMMQAKYR